SLRAGCLSSLRKLFDESLIILSEAIEQFRPIASARDLDRLGKPCKRVTHLLRRRRQRRRRRRRRLQHDFANRASRQFLYTDPASGSDLRRSCCALRIEFSARSVDLLQTREHREQVLTRLRLRSWLPRTAHFRQSDLIEIRSEL